MHEHTFRRMEGCDDPQYFGCLRSVLRGRGTCGEGTQGSFPRQGDPGPGGDVPQPGRPQAGEEPPGPDRRGALRARSRDTPGSQRILDVAPAPGPAEPN